MCCVALPRCLFDLASFFLPSHLSLKHVHTCTFAACSIYHAIHVHVSINYYPNYYIVGVAIYTVYFKENVIFLRSVFYRNKALQLHNIRFNSEICCTNYQYMYINFICL